MLTKNLALELNLVRQKWFCQNKPSNNDMTGKYNFIYIFSDSTLYGAWKLDFGITSFENV